MTSIAAATLIVSLLTLGQADGRAWVTSGFEGFAKGTFDSSGSNLYVSRAGRVQMIRTWDVNHDGNVDIFFGQSHDTVERQPARVFFQRDGKPAAAARQLLPGNGAVAVCADDLNGDGRADLVLLNASNGVNLWLDSYIYWGGPEGPSARYCEWIPTFYAWRVFASDLNGDGRKELVVANQRRLPAGLPEGCVSIHWQTEQGFPRDKRTDIFMPPILDADAADVDGDGVIDLAVSIGDKKADVRLLTGKKDGFAPAQNLAVGDEPVAAIRLIRLEGGWRVAVAREKGLELYNLPDGGPAARLDLPGVTRMAAGDLNNDGRDDLVCARGKSVDVLWGSPKGLAADRATSLPVENARGMAIGDLTGDGLADLAVSVFKTAETYTADSRVYIGGADGLSKDRVIGLETSGAEAAAIADLDHDGKNDVVFACRNGGTAAMTVPSRVYLGDEDGRFDEKRRYDPPAASAQAGYMADFNDDGFGDLLVVNEYEGAKRNDQVCRIYLGSARGLSWDRFWSFPSSHACNPSVADINKDGYLDIVISSLEDDPMYVYWGGKDGYSGDRRQTIDLRVMGLVNLADLDKDGWLDCICPHLASHKMHVLRGGPDGFSKDRGYTLPVTGATGPDTADLDGDSWLDIVVVGFWDPAFPDYGGMIAPPCHIWWGSPEGYSFTRHSQLTIEGAGSDVAIADLNRDGHLDIVMSNYHRNITRTGDSFVFWGAADHVYTNDRVTRLRADSGGGISIADFNNDGWPDVCLANHTMGGDHHARSRIHWNRKGEFNDTDVTYLPTVGPHQSLNDDLGNRYTRKLEETYTSAPFERPADGPFGKLAWKAETNFGTSVVFQVRTAATKAELDRGEWIGSDGAGSFFVESGAELGMLPREHRWVQYRAILRTPNGAASPVLTRVEVASGESATGGSAMRSESATGGSAMRNE